MSSEWIAQGWAFAGVAEAEAAYGRMEQLAEAVMAEHPLGPLSFFKAAEERDDGSIGRGIVGAVCSRRDWPKVRAWLEGLGGEPFDLPEDYREGMLARARRLQREKPTGERRRFDHPGRNRLGRDGEVHPADEPGA